MRTTTTAAALLLTLALGGCAADGEPAAASEPAPANEVEAPRGESPRIVEAAAPAPAPAQVEPEPEPAVSPSTQTAEDATRDAGAEPAAQVIAAAQTETQPEMEPIGVAGAEAQPARPGVLGYYDTQADRVEPLVESALAKAFVDQTRALPAIEPYKIYILPATVPEAVTVEQYDRLPVEAREPLRPFTIKTQQYYETIFGSPLRYARPVDLLATAGGLDTLEGKKILDFGYGQIGQVRMMAMCGAHVVGTDVSSLVATLYERESDVEVTGSAGKTGSITLHQARWPAGERAIDLVGEGYDVFIARDVLRAGKMDPQAELEAQHRVRLDVYPDFFLAELNRIMNDGGLVMIYNTGFNPPEDWPDRRLGADISSPFSRQQWADAGFELLALDANDDEAMRELGYALDMDKGENGINLERFLFARYTLARKVRDAAADDGAGEAEEEVELTPWGTPIRKSNPGG